jgi:hypothetical protein
MLGKHLLSAGDLDRAQALMILDTTAELASVTERSVKKLPTLRGRTVVNLFFEDSTRTRLSFELAAKRLSADVITFSAKGSSVSKGESLKDTALTLEAMGADAVIVRHGASGAPYGNRRTLGREGDHIGRQTLGRQFEGQSSARRILEKEVHDRTTPKGWQLLHRTLRHGCEFGCRVQNH